jgi:sodium/proline symporter
MPWEIIAVLAYFGVLLWIGAAASKQMSDVRDYYAAGKRLGFLSVAFSARATGESAWLLLGLTGMGAAVGVHAFWVVLGEVLGVTLAWLWMSRRFKRLTDRYDSITIPDYLESRFRDTRHRIRLVSAFALCVFVTIYVSAQIDATGTAFEQFLGWNYYAGALFGFVVVLTYCLSGGFVAVAWSDVFQGILMFAGLVILPIAGIAHAGGISPIMDGLGQIDPALVSWSGEADGWTLMAVCSAIGFVLIGIGFMGSPQIFVRFLALKNEGEITKGAAVAFVWTVLADSGAVLTGMAGRHIFTRPGDEVVDVLGNKAQDVLPQLTEFLFIAPVVGLFIAVVLSAIMSTIDSLLILASSAFVRDYYQKVAHPEMPDSELVGLSRKTTLILALIALAVAMSVAVFVPGRSVFWFVIFGWSGIAATFCPTVILSLFWTRFTLKGALAAMITGFAAVPFFAFLAPKIPTAGPYFSALSELPPAVLLSFVAGIVMSLSDPVGAQALAGVQTELDEAGR